MPAGRRKRGRPLFLIATFPLLGEAFRLIQFGMQPSCVVDCKYSAGNDHDEQTAGDQSHGPAEKPLQVMRPGTSRLATGYLQCLLSRNEVEVLQKFSRRFQLGNTLRTINEMSFEIGALFRGQLAP